MQNDTDRLRQYHIHADITTIFKAAYSVGWEHVRQNSIHRILYLSSVLFNFRNAKASNNPFRDYRFIVNSAGPYDSNIDRSINFLLKDDYLIQVAGNDTYQLNPIASLPSNEPLKEFAERQDWINLVVYILNVYSENRIYEFVFRDPQYQYAIKSNTQQGLDTSSNNETVKTLFEFKDEFEQAVEGQAINLSNQQYIELYFEYVFSKILKREF